VTANFPEALKTPGTRVLPLQLDETGHKVPLKGIGSNNDLRRYGAPWDQDAQAWVDQGNLIGIMLDASGLIAFDAESAMKNLDPGAPVTVADLQADNGRHLIERLFQDAGAALGDTLEMRTLHGGTHAIYRQNPDCPVLKKKLKLKAYEARLDVLLGHQSYLASGATYQVVRDADPLVLPVEVARYLNALQGGPGGSSSQGGGLGGGLQGNTTWSNPNVPQLVSEGIPADTEWTHEEILRDVLFKLIVHEEMDPEQAVQVALGIGNASLLRPHDRWHRHHLAPKVPGALAARDRKAADTGKSPGQSISSPLYSFYMENYCPDQDLCPPEPPKPAKPRLPDWMRPPAKAPFFKDDEPGKKNARSRYQRGEKKMDVEYRCLDKQRKLNEFTKWTPSQDWKTAPKGCWEFYSRVVSTWIMDGTVSREFVEFHDEHGVFRAWLFSDEHPLLAWNAARGSVEPLDYTFYPEDTRTRDERLAWLFPVPMKSGKNFVGEDLTRIQGALKALIRADELRKRSTRPTREEWARELNLFEYKRFKKLKLGPEDRMRCVTPEMVGRWLAQLEADGEVHRRQRPQKTMRGHRVYQTAAVYGIGIDPFGPDGFLTRWAEEASASIYKARRSAKAVPITVLPSGPSTPAPEVPFSI
jgi:hypothetical protein